MWQISQRLSGAIHVIPTLLVYQVLNTPPLNAKSGNVIHFILLVVVFSNNDRIRPQWRLSFQSVAIGFDMGNVDNRMDKKGYGKYWLDCIRHDCRDLIQFKLFLGQLLCWIKESMLWFHPQSPNIPYRWRQIPPQYVLWTCFSLSLITWPVHMIVEYFTWSKSRPSDDLSYIWLLVHMNTPFSCTCCYDLIIYLIVCLFLLIFYGFILPFITKPLYHVTVTDITWPLTLCNL